MEQSVPQPWQTRPEDTPTQYVPLPPPPAQGAHQAPPPHYGGQSGEHAVGGPMPGASGGYRQHPAGPAPYRQPPQQQPYAGPPPQQYAGPPQQQSMPPQQVAMSPQQQPMPQQVAMPPQQFAPQSPFPPQSSIPPQRQFPAQPPVAPQQQFPPRIPQQYAGPPPQQPAMVPQQYAGPPQQQPMPPQQQPMPPQQQSAMPQQPAMPPQQYAGPPPQQPAMQPQQQPQARPVDFPPPPDLAPVRENFLNGAGPFLEPGEQVYYGFVLKLDDAIEETPRELMIAIEGQHRTLGDIDRTSRKINRGMKWAANPMEAMTDRLAERGVEALNRKLAGPVFLGGWMSQAGWFVRYVRATAEDYGPGAFGALTSRRYLVFRAARLGGVGMRPVYAIPRTMIAGVRLEGTRGAALHGRTPRAELHFADGSMAATMMPTKSGEQVAAILQVQMQGGRF